MSRRRKTSGADAVTDLVAKLPWWVGVVLAVVAYVGLHRLAAPLAVTPLQPGQAGALVVRTIIQAMASVGQYLIPLLCLFGPALSAYRQRTFLSFRAKIFLESTVAQVPEWRVKFYISIILVSLALFINNSILNPGDAYALLLTGVVEIFFLIFITVAIFLDYFPSDFENIKSAAKVILAPLLAATIYFCASIGSEWMSELFPFSSQNIKYSAAAATLLVSATPIFVALFIIGLFELFIGFIFLAPKNKSVAACLTLALLIFLGMSKLLLVLFLSDDKNDSFSKILISRIAFDVDSMHINSCLDLNGIMARLDSNGGHNLAVIPLATSVDKGYILLSKSNLPTGKKVQDYTAEDKEKYIPKVIGYVECDNLKYESGVVAKPDPSASK